MEALFFLKKEDSDNDDSDDNDSNNDNYGLQTKRCPSQIAEGKAFEHVMLGMIENVKFWRPVPDFIR